MEKTINELIVNSDLNMRLTDEKLYINTKSSSETFALRSVHGIGVVDLVERYNEELSEWKRKDGKKSTQVWTCGILGVLILFVGFANFSTGGGGYILLGIGLLILAGFLSQKENNVKPALKSAVRIIISGAHRDFEFSKSSRISLDIAKFVALVEDTLTAYHKNN